jgi:L-fucose isomerase-like protein
LMDPAGSSIATYQIAKRYNKPVVFAWGLSCRTVDIAAYCRSNGIEAYIPDSDLELNEILNLLRARKVFGATKILYPTDWGWPSVASVSGINEPEILKEMYGIELVTISYDELTEEMEKTILDRAKNVEADEMTAVMYDNADHSYLERRYVSCSMYFYQAIVNLMKQNDCNAFTIECFEFCCSRLPQKWTITPCLIHTMLKDLGIPSACEGDLGGLLAMQMLMLVSRKSVHMGNMFYRENGKMEINHSVPGIKMNGFDKPGLPYQLGRFVESGWGTKAVVDFMQNDVKEVTVARMNPTGTGLLVLKGQLTGSRGWNEDLRGCAVSAYIVGKDSGSAHDFMQKQADYGNHLCMVYGDYSKQLQKLGQMMGIDVVVES